MKKPFNGFDRVVINYESEAWTPTRAEEILDITPDVGFMRNDGWCLGAPKEFEDVAYRLWADQWTHMIKKPETEWSEL